MQTMHAETIDDVVDILTDIVANCRKKNDRAGYFPAMYRRVTIRVREAIAAGEFEDGARLEKLDVVFANRYFDAFFTKQMGQQPTLAWDYAFRLTAKPYPLIMQHLLLGMNAHINLDLGIAAAEIAPGRAISDLQTDFDYINVILAGEINNVQAQIAAVSPLFGLIDQIGGDIDESLIRFVLTRARNAAWEKATFLAMQERTTWQHSLETYDQRVRRLARVICPSYLVPTLWRRVRSAENDDIPTVIDWLS